MEGSLPIFTKAARVGFGAILLSGVASAALAQPVASAAPDDRDARISQLENEVQTLADEVSDLKRSQAAQIETINTKPPVGVTISSGKPVIASSDGKFTAAPR